MEEKDWASAKADFVQNGLNPMEIVQKYKCDRFALAKRMGEEKWRIGRDTYLMEHSSGGPQVSPEDHSTVADELIAVGREIASDLRKGSGLSVDERKTLRARAETFRTVTEALDRAVRLARDSRGLRLGQPSRTNQDDMTHVQYTVKHVDERNKDQKNTA